MTGGVAITVNVLTGFLGAGKTHLLNRLLAQPDLAGTAVIINEFGEVGLDHLLVESVDEEVVLLKSGCICCTIRGDLKSALVSLFERSRRGELPAFSRIALETTGIADPAPIVATLAADPMLRHHFRTGNIVTVVDAPNGAANLDLYPECLRQAAMADRLVITKADLVAPEEADALRAKLASINPAADIVTVSPDVLPDRALFISDVHDADSRPAEVARWLRAAGSEPAHHHTHDVNHHRDIRAFVLTADAPLDWARFALWLTMLLNRHGAEILRLKGLLHIAGSDSPVIIQGVQHLIHPPQHLAAWPDGVPATRIVVIARGLDPSLVQRSFSLFTRQPHNPAMATAV